MWAVPNRYTEDGQHALAWPGISTLSFSAPVPPLILLGLHHTAADAHGALGCDSHHTGEPQTKHGVPHKVNSARQCDASVFPPPDSNGDLSLSLTKSVQQHLDAMGP